LIISATRSSTVYVIVLSTGERTMSRKIDPPTHIEAQIKCNQVIKLSTRAIVQLTIANHDTLSILLWKKGFNSLLYLASFEQLLCF